MEPELPLPNSLFDHLKELIKPVGQYNDIPPDESSTASYRNIVYPKYVSKGGILQHILRTYGTCGLFLIDRVQSTLFSSDTKEKVCPLTASVS